MSAPKHPWLESYTHQIDWDEKYPIAPLYELLDNAAQQYPDNVAIDYMGNEILYKELHKAVDRFAAGLQSMNIKKGDRVGLLLPNCPQHIIAYYGILKAGATVVNFSPLSARREVYEQAKDAGVKIMVTACLKSCYSKLDQLLEENRLTAVIHCKIQDAMPFPLSVIFPVIRFKYLARPDRSDARVISFNEVLNIQTEFKEVKIAPKKDVAVLQYTGGTTGVPKAAMLSHHNLYVNALQSKSWMQGLEEGKERVLAVLPFFHIFAMTVGMNLAVAGGHTIILHSKFDIHMALRDIHRKKPTLMPGVPTMFNALAQSKEVSRFDLSSIKMCISGGAPLPMEIKDAFEAITGCELIEGYGLTEASPVVACNPLFAHQKEGSIGLPLPNTIIEIRDQEDYKKSMPAGEIGELCVKGPQVMLGYWNKKKETEHCLKEGGLLRTGDLGYMDEDGYTYIVDRLKEMIITGGLNVYPRHVEEAIYEHASVSEVAVIGVKDKHFGQKVKAFIALKPDMELDIDELKEFLEPRLSKYQIPKAFEFRDELPKTMIGKISKKDLE